MALRVLILLFLTAAAVVEPALQNVFFTRVLPIPGQIGLFIANADGSDEHPLLASPDLDYEPSFHPSGDRYVVANHVPTPHGNDLMVVASAT